jgi:hypothetical protein
MYPALQDKFQGLTIAGCIEAFQAARDDIETIASANSMRATWNRMGAYA